MLMITSCANSIAATTANSMMYIGMTLVDPWCRFHLAHAQRDEGVISRKSEVRGEYSPPNFHGGLAFPLSQFLKKTHRLSRSRKFLTPSGFRPWGHVCRLLQNFGLRCRAPKPRVRKFAEPSYQNDFGNSDQCKREYRQYRTWVEAGK